MLLPKTNMGMHLVSGVAIVCPRCSQILWMVLIQRNTQQQTLHFSSEEVGWSDIWSFNSDNNILLSRKFHDLFFILSLTENFQLHSNMSYTTSLSSLLQSKRLYLFFFVLHLPYCYLVPLRKLENRGKIWHLGVYFPIRAFP